MSTDDRLTDRMFAPDEKAFEVPSGVDRRAFLMRRACAYRPSRALLAMCRGCRPQSCEQVP